MPDVLIRPAATADAPAISEIYNHYVLTSVSSFDTAPESIEERLAWLTEHDAQHPVLVAQKNGEVVAWGSLSRWRTRPAYDRSVEISVYVRDGHTAEGLGPQMAIALMEAGRALGHHAVLSQITAENEPSIKMSERLGFTEVGRLREVGHKHGRWLDVVLMELVLRAEPAAD